MAWIRQQAKTSEPFFAYVCFGSPHGPWKGAEEFKALYKDSGRKVDYGDILAYAFNCVLRINGREHQIRREVATPASFYPTVGRGRCVHLV